MVILYARVLFLLLFKCKLFFLILDTYHGKDNYLEYVLDITIAYPDGIPLDLSTIVHGLRDPCQTYLFYRLYPCSEVDIL